jgi:hypothetical protein
VLTGTLALFADALTGPLFYASAGARDAHAPRRFRAWLARVLVDRLQ